MAPFSFHLNLPSPVATNQKSVCIIGGGVSGLSTGITLRRRGHRVRILTRDESLATTSSVAAAFWYPFWTGQEPDHSWYDPRWAARTFEALGSLVGSVSGVTEATLLEYFDEEMSDKELANVVDGMWWKEGLAGINFNLLSQKQVATVRAASRVFRSGATIRTYVINMTDYLPFLRRTFADLKGEFGLATLSLENLSDLAESFDAIVDCAGLGAGELFGENSEKLFPVEGAVITVEPVQGVQDVILMHTGPVFDSYPFYIVPRGSKDIILGGTIREHKSGIPRHFSWSDVSTQDDEVQDDIRRIWNWCVEFIPQLAGAKILDVGVGYRPKRKPRVRLEEGNEIRGVRLFHNYGHGGGGVTLSWGCAEEVADWVDGLDESSTWS